MSRQDVRIRQEGSKVLIIKNGVALFEMPWEAAEQLGLAIRSKAKLAEEHAKAEEIIADQSVLFKAGVGLGLTKDPKKLVEAAKQAGGIPSGSVVSTPTIILGTPK